MDMFDGRIFSSQIEQGLKLRLNQLVKEGIQPRLAWVCVGTDEASVLYGKLKAEAAKRIGIGFEKRLIVEGEHNFEEASALISQLSSDNALTGLLLQLPVRDWSVSQLTEVISKIDPKKDVDCLHPENLGLIMAGNYRFLPATVLGVVRSIASAWKLPVSLETGQLCEHLSDRMSGKRVLIIGGGYEVGRPLAAFISNMKATVIWERSAETHLLELLSMAEVVISATGRPNLVRLSDCKSNAIVIDVGAPRGDVMIDDRESKRFVTPVPGGIGPMTVVSLMENVIVAAERLLK